MKRFFLNALFLVICNSSVFGMDPNFQQDIDRTNRIIAEERSGKERTTRIFQGDRERICRAFSTQEDVKASLLAELDTLEREAMWFHDQSIAALQVMLDYHQERANLATRLQDYLQGGSTPTSTSTAVQEADADYAKILRKTNELNALVQAAGQHGARVDEVNTRTHQQTEAICSGRRALIEKMRAFWGKVNQLAGADIFDHSGAAPAASAGPESHE